LPPDIRRLRRSSVPVCWRVPSRIEPFVEGLIPEWQVV
jgi:hypothetical protein